MRGGHGRGEREKKISTFFCKYGYSLSLSLFLCVCEREREKGMEWHYGWAVREENGGNGQCSASALVACDGPLCFRLLILFFFTQNPPSLFNSLLVLLLCLTAQSIDSTGLVPFEVANGGGARL